MRPSIPFPFPLPIAKRDNSRTGGGVEATVGDGQRLQSGQRRRPQSFQRVGREGRGAFLARREDHVAAGEQLAPAVLERPMLANLAGLGVEAIDAAAAVNIQRGFLIGNADGLPADFSRNLDHYLYGAPRRP